MGQYCFAGWCLLSVGVVVCNTAGMRASQPPGEWKRCQRSGSPAAGCMNGRCASGRARGQLGARHCTAGQYGYVPLG